VPKPGEEDVVLPSNRDNAEKHFYSLQKRLNDCEEFHGMYHSQMIDYIEKEHVETVTSEESMNDTFSLPHHAVKK
jgi:hypothetical protein